jgi:chromosome segregation ATPase
LLCSGCYVWRKRSEMKNRREPLRSQENSETKVTTLEALLALQSNDEQQSSRQNRSAENHHHSSFPTFPSGTDPTPRRKFGSQSLPRKSENPDQLMDEINHLQHALVDKFRGNQKLVSGSQFRSGFKDAPKCEQCEAKDLLLKKTKENVRSLKFQIHRLEDRIYNGKKNEKDLNLNGQSLEPSASAATGELVEELKKQISELEQMNATLLREKQSSDITAGSALQLLREKDGTIETLQNEIAELQKVREEEEKKFGLLKSQLTLKIEYANGLEEKCEETSRALEEMKALLEQ